MGNLTWLAPLIVGLLLSSCTKINPSVEQLPFLGNSLQQPADPSTPPAALTLTCSHSSPLVLSSVGAGSTITLSATSSTTPTTNSWKKDGVDLGLTGLSHSVDLANHPSGTSTYELRVEDSHGQFAICSFQVRRNNPPQISILSPLSSPTYLNVNSVMNFNVTTADPDGDTLSSTWLLGGNLEAALTGGLITGNYSPGGNAGFLGGNEIRLRVSDGIETTDAIWNLETNLYSDACNQIRNSGSTNQTCVFAGRKNFGENKSVAGQPSEILIAPLSFAADGVEGVFIVDRGHNVVRYWNRSASSRTVLNVEVEAGKIRTVVGVPTSVSLPTSWPSPLALRRFLNAPYQVAWDGSNLYLTEENGLVSRIDSSGILTTIMGAGVSDTAGAPASSHRCSAPRGLYLDSATNTLYVGCTNAAAHIKAINLSTMTAQIVIGDATSNPPNDSAASVPRLSTSSGTVWGMTMDNLGNLYFLDSCRARVWNRTGATTNIAGFSISTDQVRTIWGDTTSNTCATAVVGAANLARMNYPKAILWKDDVLYVAFTNSNHGIYALNTTAGSLNVGSITILANEVAKVMGTGSGSGFAGDGGPVATAQFAQISGLAYLPDTSSFLIADFNNKRVRMVNSSMTVSTLIGGGETRTGFPFSIGTVEAPSAKLGQLTALAYSDSRGELFAVDPSSDVVWQINKTGELQKVLGGGASINEDEAPLTAILNEPSHALLIDDSVSDPGVLIVSQAQSSRHLIRAWNRGTSAKVVFGRTIAAGRVRTIAGAGAAGNGTGDALTAGLNYPRGLASDGSTLYIADTSNSCIKALDSSGVLTVISGTCGLFGSTDGTLGIARLGNAVRGISYFDNGSLRGLLIADTSNSKIRFQNLGSTSGILAGVSIGIGELVTLAGGGSFFDEGVPASNSNLGQVASVRSWGTKICWTSENYHHVRCLDSNTGLVTTVHGVLPGVGTSGSMSPVTATELNSQDLLPASPGQIEGSISPTQTFAGLLVPSDLIITTLGHMFISERGSGQIRLTIPAY